MIGKKVLEETPITNVEAKNILNKVEKDYKEKEREIGYELDQSIKYAKKFSKVTDAKRKKYEKELTELGLPKKVIVELINIMPKYEDTVKTILFKKTDFTDFNKILEILK